MVSKLELTLSEIGHIIVCEAYARLPLTISVTFPSRPGLVLLLLRVYEPTRSVELLTSTSELSHKHLLRDTDRLLEPHARGVVLFPPSSIYTILQYRCLR
jgi:hypothetical protein